MNFSDVNSQNPDPQNQNSPDENPALGVPGPNQKGVAPPQAGHPVADVSTKGCMPEAVGYTATIVAAKRVLEQHNPQPLVMDPYAAQLVGAEPDYLLRKWSTVAQTQGIPLADVLAKRTRYVAVRTRFFDEAIQTFVQTPRSLHPDDQPTPTPQVVLLGAGLDTRSTRLSALAQARCYEVDRPAVLAHKRYCLQESYLQASHLQASYLQESHLQASQPSGPLPPLTAHHIAAAHHITAAHHMTAAHHIAADLTQPQIWLKALETQGWCGESPTFWLLEGVLMYLTAIEATNLVQLLGQVSGQGSSLGLDGVRSGSIQASQQLRQHSRGRVVRHWQFGHDRPQQWLRDCGWEAQITRPSTLDWARSRYPAHLPESPEMGGYASKRGVWLAIAQRN
ncbi:MAG: class I SAM-dependent methyltransferase [Prochlorothrix sp.]